MRPQPPSPAPFSNSADRSSPEESLGKSGAGVETDQLALAIEFLERGQADKALVELAAMVHKLETRLQGYDVNRYRQIRRIIALAERI